MKPSSVRRAHVLPHFVRTAHATQHLCLLGTLRFAQPTSLPTGEAI